MFSILWIPSLPFTSVVSAVPGHPLCNQGLLFFFLFFSFFSISDLSTSILLFYLSFHHPFILRFCSLMGIGVDYVVNLVAIPARPCRSGRVLGCNDLMR